MTSVLQAYNTGWRAGRCGSSARCPYRGAWNILKATAWKEGYHKGMAQRQRILKRSGVAL